MRATIIWHTLDIGVLKVRHWLVGILSMKWSYTCVLLYLVWCCCVNAVLNGLLVQQYRQVVRLKETVKSCVVGIEYSIWFNYMHVDYFPCLFY